MELGGNPSPPARPGTSESTLDTPGGRKQGSDVRKCFIPRFAPVLLAFLTQANAQEAPRRTLSVVVETFSLPLAEAAVLLREKRPDSKLHARCVEGLADKSVRQEGLTVIRTLERSVASNAAFLKIPYPTEYEAGEYPNMTGTGPGLPPPDGFPTSLVPVVGTSFETRDFGFLLLLEATKLPDGRFYLRIQPEWTRRAGHSVHGQDGARLTMPEVETRKLMTGVDVVAGKPSLLGTFNRTPESRVEPLAATRVWFAFVTITSIES